MKTPRCPCNRKRPRHAAAVAIADDGSQRLLLVKTSSGRRWTFPKGRVNRKHGESGPQAAVREATEEAGLQDAKVVGCLGTFRHSKRSGKTSTVHAVLVVADADMPFGPHENGRKPRWRSPEKVLEKLAKKRRGRRIRQLRTIVAAARLVAREHDLVG